MTQLEIEYVKKLKELIEKLSPFCEFWGEESDSYFKLKREIAELGKQCQFEMLCDPDIFEPDVDFRRDIAEELPREELINRLCEMHEAYKKMRKEWFEKTQLNNLKP